MAGWGWLGGSPEAALKQAWQTIASAPGYSAEWESWEPSHRLVNTDKEQAGEGRTHTQTQRSQSLPKEQRERSPSGQLREERGREPGNSKNPKSEGREHVSGRCTGRSRKEQPAPHHRSYAPLPLQALGLGVLGSCRGFLLWNILPLTFVTSVLPSGIGHTRSQG